jgi:hypothetical protein
MATAASPIVQLSPASRQPGNLEPEEVTRSHRRLRTAQLHADHRRAIDAVTTGSLQATTGRLSR